MKKIATIIAIIFISIMLCSCQDILNTVNDTSANSSSGKKSNETTTPTPSPTPTLEDELKMLNEADGENLEIVGFDDIKVGDTILFGSYEQDDDLQNGKEPIEWIVLSVDDNQALLFSKYIIDCYPYKQGNEFIDWENSDLRYWLNDTFLKEAFNQKELNTIKRTIISTLPSVIYNKKGSADTIDKIFVLSIQEVTCSEYGFSEDYAEKDINRCGIITKAVKKKMRTVKYLLYDGQYYGNYWLRSTGKPESIPATKRSKASVHYTATRVKYVGDVESDYFASEASGVRPALFIRTK